MGCAFTANGATDCHGAALRDAARETSRRKAGAPHRPHLTLHQPNRERSGANIGREIHTRLRADGLRTIVNGMVGRANIAASWKTGSRSLPVPPVRSSGVAPSPPAAKLRERSSAGAQRTRNTDDGSIATAQVGGAGVSISGCKVSAEPGSGYEAEIAAELQNEGTTDGGARAQYFASDYYLSTHPPVQASFPGPPAPSCPACAYRFQGSAQSCPPPALDLQSMDDYLAVDFAYTARYVEIEGATAEEEKLLLTAWALMMRNIDLLEWVLCWMYGIYGGECYIRRIFGVDAFGFTSLVFIRVEPDAHTPGSLGAACTGSDFVSTAGFAGGLIRVCGTAIWDQYLRMFASSEVRDRMCSALDLAASLFHEITHLCSRAIFDDPCECERSYMVENMLRWCLMQRYPDASASTCCQKYALPGDLDTLWGSSCTVYPGEGCL